MSHLTTLDPSVPAVRGTEGGKMKRDKHCGVQEEATVARHFLTPPAHRRATRDGAFVPSLVLLPSCSKFAPRNTVRAVAAHPCLYQSLHSVLPFPSLQSFPFVPLDFHRPPPSPATPPMAAVSGSSTTRHPGPFKRQSKLSSCVARSSARPMVVSIAPPSPSRSPSHFLKGPSV